MAFSTTVCHDIASRMIFAGAPEEDVTILDTNDFETVFSKLDEIETDVVYVVTNMKHVKAIKAYLGGNGNA